MLTFFHFKSIFYYSMVNQSFLIAWENVSLEPDDSHDEYILGNLFAEFPFYKFIPTPNRMFYMLICMKPETFQYKVFTMSKASMKNLKPLIKWGLKYNKRKEKNSGSKT